MDYLFLHAIDYAKSDVSYFASYLDHSSLLCVVAFLTSFFLPISLSLVFLPSFPPFPSLPFLPLFLSLFERKSYLHFINRNLKIITHTVYGIEFFFFLKIFFRYPSNFLFRLNQLHSVILGDVHLPGVTREEAGLTSVK